MSALGHVFKSLYLDGRILLHHGTINPSRVQLSQSDQFVWINPRDWRARKKIIADTVRGRFPRNQRFWRLGIQEFEPEVVLDVGVNYGECIFSTEYPESVSVFGFEPNPAIQPYLQQSKAEHPNGDQIHLNFVLASDGSSQAVDFFVNEKWSGSSTAAIGAAHGTSSHFKTITVTSTTVDQVIQDKLPGTDRMFFKIDVEGFEYRVLEGMKKSISGVKDVLGMIEFDPDLLDEAGENTKEFWAFLNDTFSVYLFDKFDVLHEVSGSKIQDLHAICGTKIHTDLVLVKSDTVALENKLVNAWSQKYRNERKKTRAA
jgi:FkbM family methyltransferase